MNRLAASLLCLLIPALAGLPGAALAEPGSHTISVTGHGEVRAAPDLAIVRLGVSAQAPTADEARTAVNRIVPTLLKLTRDLGIPEARVRATALSVSPDTEWVEARRTNRVTGYTVSRQIAVELRDLDRLGDLLEKSVTLGANVVSGPELDSIHRPDLERQALALAVADARKNADVLATALGTTVGPPRQIAMAGADAPRQRLGGVVVTAARLSAGAPEMYKVGELNFEASVEVSFELGAGTPPH